MLPDIVKQYNDLTGMPLKKITSIRRVCSMMNEVPVAKSLCSELHCALQLFLVQLLLPNAHFQ